MCFSPLHHRTVLRLRSSEPVVLGVGFYDRRSFPLILAFPFRDDDCLDSPHRELHSGRKLIATTLRPIPVITEKLHLHLGPALGLAGKLRPLLKLYPILNTVQPLPQRAHPGCSQSRLPMSPLGSACVESSSS